jgi:hypothetical protein
MLTTDRVEIEALAGSNPSFAAWKQNEPYTIALLIKGRYGDRRNLATRTPRAVRGRLLAFLDYRGGDQHQRVARHLPLETRLSIPQAFERGDQPSGA